MPTPASFLFIFGLFKQTLQFLQQINVKKCPSSIRCRDLNPQPLEHESRPITTRPGLQVILAVGSKGVSVPNQSELQTGREAILVCRLTQ